MQIIGTMTLLNCRPIHEGEGTMISTDDMGQLGAMQIFPEKPHFRLRLLSRVLCSGPKPC